MSLQGRRTLYFYLHNDRVCSIWIPFILIVANLMSFSYHPSNSLMDHSKFCLRNAAALYCKHNGLVVYISNDGDPRFLEQSQIAPEKFIDISTWFMSIFNNTYNFIIDMIAVINIYSVIPEGQEILLYVYSLIEKAISIH